MAELESITQTKIIKALRALGHKVYRLRATDRPGTPDLLVMNNGKAWFIEVKRVGEQPTPLQLHEHEELRRQGFCVEIWDALSLTKTIMVKHRKRNH